MKKLSRKTLVSIATAVAVTAGSLATPAFAADTDTATDTGSNSVSSQIVASSSDEEGKLDIEKIGGWVAMITSVVTTLSALVTLLTKVQNLAK